VQLVVPPVAGELVLDLTCHHDGGETTNRYVAAVTA
jgi:hypothetical protein